MWKIKINSANFDLQYGCNYWMHKTNKKLNSNIHDSNEISKGNELKKQWKIKS